MPARRQRGNPHPGVPLVDLTCADDAHHYVRHPLPARDGQIIWVCTHGPHARTTR